MQLRILQRIPSFHYLILYHENFSRDQQILNPLKQDSQN